MSDPYYRMFPREWDDGTMVLTLEQEGALVRICNAINSRGGPIPDDDKTNREMAHRCRISFRRWGQIKSALLAAGKITIEQGMICQRRALEEVDHRATLADERAENGAKGGRKRAENLAKTPRKRDENLAKTSRKRCENAVKHDAPPKENSDLSVAYPEPEPEKRDPLTPSEGTAPDKPSPQQIEAAFQRFWRDYPSAGRVNAAQEMTRFQFGRLAVQHGADAIADAAARYAAAVRDADSKPVGIARFLGPESGLLAEYLASGGAAGGDVAWRSFMADFKRHGVWRGPGEAPQIGRAVAGCQVPEAVLAEYGYGPPRLVAVGAGAA